MGFLLEKLDGRNAAIGDTTVCQQTLKKLHGLGYQHGDANRHNFLVTESNVKIIDFEKFSEQASMELQLKDTDSLKEELIEESGRGAGFVFKEDEM